MCLHSPYRNYRCRSARTWKLRTLSWKCVFVSEEQDFARNPLLDLVIWSVYTAPLIDALLTVLYHALHHERQLRWMMRWITRHNCDGSTSRLMNRIREAADC